MDGPPEIVDGMVIYVITSWSERPARRARNPPIVCIPSCELPARRMTTSRTVRRAMGTIGSEPEGWGVAGRTIFGEHKVAGGPGFVNEMEPVAQAVGRAPAGLRLTPCAGRAGALVQAATTRLYNDC